MVRHAVPHALERDGFISRVRPCSPTLRPIQNVTMAPMTEPIVASMRVEPEQVRLRAARMMTGEVDAERQEEDERRVERAHQDQAPWGEEVAEQ